MERRQENVFFGNRILLIPVYVVLTIVLGLVLVTSICEPQNNLLPWQMLIGTVFATGVFLFSLFGWSRLQGHFTKKNQMAWLPVLLFGVILYGIGCIGGNRNHEFLDYASVYQCALELAKGQELSNPRYFAIYTNNVKPAIFLSAIFRLAMMFHVPEFYVALFLNVWNVLLAVWAISVLLDYGKKRLGICWGLALTALCIPVYVFIGTFYSDAMSFGWGLIALACLKKGANATRKRMIYAVIGGLAAVYGAEQKMTAIIPVVAGACVLIVCEKWRRKDLVIVFLCSCLAFYGLSQIWSDQYPFAVKSRTTGNPLCSWVAIGMHGDGSWNESKEMVDRLNEMDSKSEKLEFSKRYMEEHWKEAFTMEHLLRKTRRNFASGMLGCNDYLSTSDDGTFIWSLLAPWGKHYWRMSQITFCYMAAIYCVMLMGCIVSLASLFRGEELPSWKMVADISFLGIFLFLLIWESNNRQLYNQLPVLILGMLTNGRYLLFRKEENNVENTEEVI